MLLGFSFYVIGIRSEVFYMTSISLPLFIYGLILSFWGIEMLKKLFIPVGLFALTLPIFPLHRITMPLQMLSAKAASSFFNMVGVPSFSEGSIVHIMDKTLSVVPGCSGVKSLFSLFFISIIYSHFVNVSTKTKVAIILLTIPTSFVLNIVRISLVGFYILYNGNEGSHEFHDYSGIILLALSVGLLSLVFNQISNESESEYEV